MVYNHAKWNLYLLKPHLEDMVDDNRRRAVLAECKIYVANGKIACINVLARMSAQNFSAIVCPIWFKYYL